MSKHVDGPPTRGRHAIASKATQLESTVPTCLPPHGHYRVAATGFVSIDELPGTATVYPRETITPPPAHADTVQIWRDRSRQS